MTWVDDVDESMLKLTHSTYPTRSPYMPPPLRHIYNNGVSDVNYNNTPSFNFSAEATPSRPRFNSQERGRSPWTRGRGRGRGRNSSWSGPNPNSYDIANKFEELEVTKDDHTTDNNNGSAINFDAYEGIPVEASGSNIPQSVTSFSEIDLGEALNKNIKKCKYVKPTPIQRHAIPIAIAGRDLIACAQTGSGKTAAFCFPIICMITRDRLKQVVSGDGGVRVAFPTALILSPTRELSCQIHEEATKFAQRTGVKIVVAYGGAPIAQQFNNMEKGVDILVATPGRLVDMIERERVSLKMIKYLALDEADRMLDMGFEQQIRKIVQQMDMPPPGARQTMLFSATFPDEIQRLASDFLSDYIFLAVGKVGSSTDLISQRVELVKDMDKRSCLMNLLHTHKPNGAYAEPALTLVFVETKRGADALEHWLSMNGFPAIAIHGDKAQRERERALKSFKSGVNPILVATDVASRGLDIPYVAHVINFDLPKDIDNYVHRIGRTGRAGNSGLATAFFSDKNLPLAKPLVELMQEAKQEVPSWLIKYAENSSGGSSARVSRHGRIKFGGHDFRRSYQSRSENYYNSGDNHVGYGAGAEYYADFCSGSYAGSTNQAGDFATAIGGSYTAHSHADYSAPPANVGAYAYTNVDSNATGSLGYGFNATGWD